MHEDCTVYRTMSYLSKRWALLVLFEMGRGDEWKRFSELRDRIGCITPKVLTERLRELEDEGLIEHRIDASAFPVRSEYRLTEAGTELTELIQGIKMWALKWKIDNIPCMKLDCGKCRLRSLDAHNGGEWGGLCPNRIRSKVPGHHDVRHDVLALASHRTTSPTSFASRTRPPNFSV